MTQRPVSPCRLRVNAASKRGHPQLSASADGAQSSLLADGVERMSQRVSAALGSACAVGRSRMTVTPLACAPSTRRREATRSRTLGLPGISTITAPSAGQLKASAPARKASSAWAARSSRTQDGSIPSSARPVGEISPCSRAEKSWRIHSSFFLARTRWARPKAKPVALASPAKTSCSAPRAMPPRSAASAPAWPRAHAPRRLLAPKMGSRSWRVPASFCARSLICSLFVLVC